MSEDLSEILLKTPPLKLWEDDRMEADEPIPGKAEDFTIEEMMAMPGLEEFCEGPSDQEQVSSCSAHALVNALEILRNRYHGKRSSIRLSPEAAYNAFRERVNRLDEDSGLTMFELRLGAQKQGVIPESVWTPDSPFQPTPEEYDTLSLKFPGTMRSMSMSNQAKGNGTSEVITDKDWYLRRILYHLKVERLPICIATKIPEDDLRSTVVNRTGVRSASPYRSSRDSGYWHAECLVNTVYIGAKIYAKVIGSWGLRGDRGYWYIPWEDALSEPLYARPGLAPKEGWA